jgi:hypothetical protein
MQQYVYIISDATGPDRDRAFLSEEASYSVWIAMYAEEMIYEVEGLEQTKKDQILSIWNDPELKLVDKVRTVDKMFGGRYLDQDCVKLIRMEIEE